MSSLLVFFIAILMSSVSLATPKDAVSTFKSAAQELVNQGFAEGVGVAVVSSEGIIWSGGFGLRDKEKNLPVSGDTIFPVASVSKIFLGLSLANLWQQGLIDPRAKLTEIAPEVPISNPWEETHPLRLIHLFEHTSGIQEIIAPWYQDSFPPYMRQIKAMKDYLKPAQVSWPPGSTVTYSNYNYIAASHMIEKVTGMDFDRYMEKTILKPLNMKHSSFRLKEVDKDLLAKGYRYGEKKPLPYFEGFYRSAAGLFSSPNDLGNFIYALLRTDKSALPDAFTDKALNWMEKPKSAISARQGLKLGHGPGLVSRQSRGRIFMGHNGIIDGFLATLYYNRQLGFGFALLFNTHTLPKAANRGKFIDLILSTFFADKTIDPPPEPKSKLSLKRFEGYYHFYNPRFPVTGSFDLLSKGRWVKARDNKLIVTPIQGESYDLFPTSQDNFRKSYEVEASHHFGVNDQGETYQHQLINKFYKKTSSLWPLTRLFLFIFSIVALVASGLYGLLLLFSGMLQKKPFGEILSQSGLSPLPLAVLMTWLAFLLPMDNSRIALTINVNTIVFYLASLLFAPAAVLTLFANLYFAHTHNRGRQLYLISSGLLIGFLGFLCFSYGLFAIKMWDFGN